MNKRKLLFYPILLILIVGLFSLGISASTDDINYPSDDAGVHSDEAILSENSGDIDNMSDGEKISEETASAEGDDAIVNNDVLPDESTIEDSADNVNATENPFAIFFDSVKTYATEILSALTLIASLILAYAYKSGLTPVITNALTNLGKLLSGMRDSVSESDKASREITAAISERLEAAEVTVAKLTESIEAVSHTLKIEEESAAEKKKLSEVLMAQVDMMYSLFISSALPEYQKEAVRERIAEMKEAIADAQK